MVQGAQQLSKPVEGLELPAHPYKIQPPQSERPPAVSEIGGEGEMGRERRGGMENVRYKWKEEEAEERKGGGREIGSGYEKYIIYK